MHWQHPTCQSNQRSNHLRCRFLCKSNTTVSTIPVSHIISIFSRTVPSDMTVTSHIWLLNFILMKWDENPRSHKHKYSVAAWTNPIIQDDAEYRIVPSLQKALLRSLCSMSSRSFQCWKICLNTALPQPYWENEEPLFICYPSSNFI